MTLSVRFSLFAMCVLGSGALAACGGGGGASPGGAGNLPTGISTSPAAASAQAAGRVLDLDSGAPLAGATVVIGNTLVSGATPPATPPGDDVSAVTGADGSYTIAGLHAGTRTFACGQAPSGPDGYCSGQAATTNAAFVHVFTSDHVTLHGYASIGAGPNAVRDLRVTKPTALDVQRLTKLNFYRTQAPDPNNGFVTPPIPVPPVVQDEYLTEASRFFANYTPPLGTPEGQDTDQGSSGVNVSPDSRYHSRGGFPSVDDFEDLGPGGGNSDILLPGSPFANDINNLPEDGFYVEGPGSGHFTRIMDSGAIWVGFGAASAKQYGLYNAVNDLVHAPI